MNYQYFIGASLSFVGGSLLFGVIFFLKQHGFNLKNFLYISPLILTNQFIFNYLYSSVYPDVSKGWIVTTIVVSSTVFILSFLLLGEDITYKTILALIFITIGVYFLK